MLVLDTNKFKSTYYFKSKSIIGAMLIYIGENVNSKKDDVYFGSSPYAS